MNGSISIGNSDDKLSQRRWSEFIDDLLDWVAWATEDGGQIRGVRYSAPDSPWQNMCVECESEGGRVEKLKAALRSLVARYGQDSIAWLAGDTEFLKPAGPDA